MTRLIRIRGARTRNLKGVDLDIPIGKVTVLTGVSGSGKTSLALDTLHAEARRRFVEALGGPAAGAAPPVDVVEGLPPTLAVPARPALPAARNVGELTGCQPLLAVLFARLGVVRSPTTGAALPIHTADQVADHLLTLTEGTRLTVSAPLVRDRATDWAALFDELRLQGFSRVRLDGQPLHLDDARPPPADSAHRLDLVVDRVRVKADRHDRLAEAARTAFAAGDGRMEVEHQAPGGPVSTSAWASQPWDPDSDARWPTPRPERFDRRQRSGACAPCGGSGSLDSSTCPDCLGSGTGPLGRRVHWRDQSYDATVARSVTALSGWLTDAPVPAGLGPVQGQLQRRLQGLVSLGLGHLPLNRLAADLAPGERGRVALAARTAHELTDLVFILDEPTSHLGPDGVAAVRRRLAALRDRGLTVVVIDHHPAILAVADQVVEFGPGAGLRGGRVLYAGPPNGLIRTDTPTGRLLQGALAPSEPPPRVQDPERAIRLLGARGRNLQGIDLVVPIGALTVVTGPSGAGKRTLVEDTFGAALALALGQAGPPALPHSALTIPPGAIDRVVRLERAGRGASKRSCVATACGTWGPLRTLLAQTREARVRGLRAEHFSFNTPLGRCGVCEGLGFISDGDSALAASPRTCPECDGDRLGRATRPVRWQGHTAGELLHLDVDAAVALFERHRRIRRPLRALAMVGLGHLPLGRPTGSLSGGEHQRLQLARELARAADPGTLRAGTLAGTAMVLETPSAGLHYQDAIGVADGLARMAAAGATILCSDQHPALLAVASRVITLGPGPGPAGGRVVATHDAGR